MLEKYTRLAMLSVDFVEAAQTYGRLIIEEHLLPNAQKTIRQLGWGGVRCCAGVPVCQCASSLFVACRCPSLLRAWGEPRHATPRLMGPF